MVRILHVVTYMGRGGLEIMLMNYYRNLDRNKVQFDFIVHRKEEADFDSEIENMGGKIYRFPKLVPWSRSYRRKLTEFFKSHTEYQIIHVHQDCLSSVALECAKDAEVPVRIAHCHNASQDKNLKYPIKLFYKRRIIDAATDLFTCSILAGEWMFGKGLDMRLVPNPVNTNLFEFNQNLRLKKRTELGLEGKKILINVARFAKAKNHSFLIDVFEKVHQKHSDSVLILVGDGELQKAVEKRVSDTDLENSVHFLGIRSDVNELLMAADLLLFPSIYEGFPVSLVEAQTSGLPCLISETISEECCLCPDLVQQLPIKQGSEIIWARSVESILNKLNTDDRDLFAKKVAEAGYGVQQTALNLQNFYLDRLEVTS